MLLKYIFTHVKSTTTSMISLNIASYNCQGFKPRNYGYIVKLFNNDEFLCLQEDWLYNFEFSKFSNILNNCNFFAKYCMKDDSSIMADLVVG